MTHPGCTEPVELADLDPVTVRPGDLVRRVGAELERAERHLEGVDGKDAPREGVAGGGSGTMSRYVGPLFGSNTLTIPSKRKIEPCTTGMPSFTLASLRR